MFVNADDENYYIFKEIYKFKEFIYSKKATTRWLEKSHSNDKLLRKVMFSSYPMELNIFIEASLSRNKHTGGKGFCICCF